MAIPAAIPVYEAVSGWRLPVTLTQANGKSVTVAASGARLPVVVVASGGVPVVDISGTLGV